MIESPNIVTINDPARSGRWLRRRITRLRAAAAGRLEVVNGIAVCSTL